MRKLEEEKEFNSDYLKKEVDKLKAQKDYNYVQITDLNTALQHVDESIDRAKHETACCRERIKGHDNRRSELLLQERKMQAMHAAILTQVMEQEFQLKQKKLLKQEHVEKLL